jgi:hypothetical protein
MMKTITKMQHLRNIALRDEAVARASRRAARYAYAAWVAEELGFARVSERCGLVAERSLDSAGLLESLPLPSVG